MRRKEFAARIWSKIIAGEKEHGFLKAGDRILAAISGGPDSVCLAHYLASARRRKKIDVAFLHVNHGLRGNDSKKDARFVENLAADLDVPLTVVRVPTRKQAAARGKGLEDAARELRYDALIKGARRLRFKHVATAHQMDDQAETVLLHLLRGTRLKALGGIPPRRPLAKGIEVIRPLLALTRADVLAYLSVHELKFRVDKSNLSLEFTRNWIRRKVLPLLETKNPRIREHLAGISRQARELAGH